MAFSGEIIAYWVGRVVYNLRFHPLSKYPGPKLAAIIDAWWACIRPINMLSTLECREGDVVHIAPNELVFLTLKAAQDIYLATDKNLELFVQVGYDALDTGDGGISGETNPVRHREIAKRLAPAFSARNFKAKEGTVMKHINLFIKKMKDIEAGEKGAELQSWTDWLALDLSVDMTYGREMGQVRDMKDSVFMSSGLKLNAFVTMSEITRKLRLLAPLAYLTIPPSIWFDMPMLIKMNNQDIKTRIERRGTTDHLDYFEQLVPAEGPVPEDDREINHLENVAIQLLLASWQPLADQFYTLIFLLLRKLDAYAALVNEACGRESLRLHQETVDGLPRVCPGAVVDGTYIPQGVICQVSYFAAARSPRYFTDPLAFRPERWLSPDHPLFDPRYQDDDLFASKPFSQGPRGCPGGAIAMAVIQLFVSKVLWNFDLEAAPGQDGLSFEKHFKWLTFWKRPPFWVRFKPVKR